ncbi:MAG TPA: potassium/proton antiporter [Acetobacteraceae bacterium]|nr:potassium/proton antiporter [Acetobacteraceae bacterium]
MDAAHLDILIGGTLGIVAILAGIAGRRFGTPLLLVFLVLGMLAGEDGPGGIRFSDFQLTYLLGSIALVVILFEGGQKTSFAMVREAGWPALLLATLGVVLTAGIVASVIVAVSDVDWIAALLLGSLVAPTDAAAVAAVLRTSGVVLPHRVLAILELESGLNDPMSVFLTVLLTHERLHVALAQPAYEVIELLREMGGGAIAGVLAGAAMIFVVRRLRLDHGLRSVLLLAMAAAVFGGAQLRHVSGFLAVYVAAVLVGNRGGETTVEAGSIFGGFAWVCQIGLFLMLGLLVTPHDTLPWVPAAVFTACVLIFVARPVATVLCLVWFGVPWREMAFIAWVGLRGAVPIYLAVIPVLAGTPRGELAFVLAFVIVIVSLVVQGWTVGPVARLLRFSVARVQPAIPVN